MSDLSVIERAAATLPKRPSQAKLCELVDSFHDAHLLAKRADEWMTQIKKYLIESMERLGIGGVRGDRAEAYLCDVAPSVVIQDGAYVPMTRVPDKKKLIRMWRDGELPPGVEVTQGATVRFKAM